MFDVILRNPLIYDGLGRAPFRNDVGVKDGMIHAIGDLARAEAAMRLDAGHLCLCPGFIDVHSHADMAVHKENHDSMVEPLLRQGITTFVGGNCGVALGPISERHAETQWAFYDFFLGEDPHPHIGWKSFGEMLDTYERQGVALNMAVLAPHGILRMDALGDKTTVADAEDIRRMRRLLAECLEAGAIGLSTGLMYFPGLFSDERELTELAHEVHRYNGVFTSHLRSYNSDTLGKAIDEVLTVGQVAEVPVQISHLFWVPNLPGKLNRVANAVIKGASRLYNKHPFPLPLDSDTKPYLERIAERNRQGQPVGVDAMPTSAGFTHLLAFFPPWSLQGGLDTILARIADKPTRARIRRSIEEGVPRWPHREGDSWSMNLFKVMGWDCAFLMSVKSEKNRHLIGKSFSEIGKERGLHPFDVACDLLLEEQGRVLIFETVTFPGDPLVELSLKGTLVDPNVSIVTDSILLGFGMPSHLFYDCVPKFLSQYALRDKHLSLAEAIRKCTSLPAKQLQIKNRGRVEEGCHADLVLFDPARLQTNGTAMDPAHFPSGIEHVFVNGQHVVSPKGYTPRLKAGKVLRRGR